ncbi:MAG: hypothetical protein RL539_211, partial [Pseudomonadota bacterium]
MWQETLLLLKSSAEALCTELEALDEE